MVPSLSSRIYQKKGEDESGTKRFRKVIGAEAKKYKRRRPRSIAIEIELIYPLDDLIVERIVEFAKEE